MPYRRATPQETMDWLGSGRVLFGARPPACSTEKPTGSSETQMPGLPQDLLEQMYQVFEAGFRAQDAYQAELQKQSAADGSPASPPLTGHNGASAAPDLDPAETESEPSLDRMLDLNNPQVLKGLGPLVEELIAQKPKPSESAE